MTIETKYDIGDAIYTASASGIDRSIIKAVKVTGLHKTVAYGFQARNNLMFFHYPDEHYYMKETDLFTTVEEAEARHKVLKARKAEADKKERQKAYKKRKEQLERELSELTPETVDPDDVEEDD